MRRFIRRFPATPVAFAVCVVLIPVLWHQFHELRSYLRQLRQDDYCRVLAALESGRITGDTAVSDYVRVGHPVTVKSFGPFTKYEHGFPGGLGHAVVLLARGDRLLLAYNYSCLGHKEHFNAMTPADQRDWLRHYE